MQNTKNIHVLTRKGIFGFTLVELIVVITILAILGTIAFLSLTGYTGGARDSSRVSDIASISKSLEISYIKTNSYPSPDGYFSVTYSGGSVWTQGTVGSTVMNTLNAGGGANISKKPTDPLNSKEYTYSKLSYGKAFQIKADYEGDTLSYIPGITQTYAVTGNPSLSYIKGNYNGVSAKTQTGSMIYLLALPSIITSTGTFYLSGIDMGTASNFLSGTLLFHGGSNTTGINFNPKAVYASGALPSNDSERALFASGIAQAYSGTTLATNPQIKVFLDAVGNTGTLATRGGELLSTSLGGSQISSYLPPQPTSTPFSATGGIITYTDSSGLNPRSSPAYPGGYTIHTFTSVGTSTFQVISGSSVIDYLIVGGGGGSGPASGVGYSGGGGGGGGYLTGNITNASSGSYIVTVGGGGAVGVNGGNSSLSGIIATGGGHGAGAGGNGTTATSGGSGGGGGGSGGGGATGINGQGYGGGTYGGTFSEYGGGGGGAGGPGGNGGVGSIGIAGIGLSNNISGSSMIYAKGGRGQYNAVPSVTGASNTGNGGEAGWSTVYADQPGGSGIIIIRYRTP